MIGISFHVGSGCAELNTYGEAIQVARNLFDFAESVGYHFTLLDIGGGFPGENQRGKQFKNNPNHIGCQLTHCSIVCVSCKSCY